MLQPITDRLESSPIDDLSAKFGSRLQCLPHQHKAFLLKCLAHQYAAYSPMSDLIDNLDPNALIPKRVCDAIIALDGLDGAELLSLMESLIAQFQSKAV